MKKTVKKVPKQKSKKSKSRIDEWLERETSSRQMFSIAAYNAGEGRIAKAQALPKGEEKGGPWVTIYERHIFIKDK